MSKETLTIPSMFQCIAAEYPNRLAIQVKEGETWHRWTYKELETDVLKVAEFLLQAGLKKGDFICLVLENRPQWPIVYLGIMRAGLSCIPIDAQLSSHELLNFIQDSGAMAAFTSKEIFTKRFTPEIQSHLKKIVVLGGDDLKEDKVVSFSECLKRSNPRQVWPQVAAEDIASLIYTSGVTGQPKGVMLTHKNLCSNSQSILKMKLLTPNDNFIAVLPFHHTYPFMTNFIVPLLSGGTTTFCPVGFKAQDLADLMREAKITILVGVPQLFALLARNGPPSQTRKAPR